jgi:hypothetical protein
LELEIDISEMDANYFPLPEDYPLPTIQRCRGFPMLSDKECYEIQTHLDPYGTREHQNWQRDFQPEIIRQYMYMKSYPEIEEALKKEGLRQR